MVFSVDSPDWVQIRKSANGMQMELLKIELGNREVDCVLLNKHDSVYPVFGAYILYVLKDQANYAQSIIEDFLSKNGEDSE